MLDATRMALPRPLSRRGLVTKSYRICREEIFLDIAVAVAVGPIAEVTIAELVAEEGQNAVLGSAFGLADGHTRRILPVRRLCIMPCLIWRALASLASRAAISASISERTAAMAVCSSVSEGIGISNAFTSAEFTESKVDPLDSFTQLGSSRMRL